MKKLITKLLLLIMCVFFTPFVYGQYVNQLTDYWRTKYAGEWTSSTIWESSPDGTTWYEVSNGLVPDSTSIVTIQNDVTLNSTLTAGVVTIKTGATFTMQSAAVLRFGIAKLFTVDGTFENQNPANNSIKNSTATYVVFNANSFYKLTAELLYGTNCGLVPTATWNTTSTVLITGTKTSGGIWGISGATLGNLTYDCPNQTSTYVCLLGGFSTTTINGNLNIVRTGTGKIGLTQSKIVVNNYNQTGGVVSINGMASGAGLNRIIQVNGNFNMSGTSTFYFTNSTSSSANYKGYLMLYGNLNIESGATITPYVGTLVGRHYPVMFFCGTSSQTITNNGTINGVINDSIANTNGVFMNSDYKVGGRLSLMSGTLNLGTNKLIYSGSTIYKTSGLINASATGATIELANTDSLNIPAALFTGNISNLTMNASGSVSTSENMTVTNNLTLTAGKLFIGNNNLTVNGALTGGTASNYIVTNGSGKLIQMAEAGVAKIYPIGSSKSSYDPVSITATIASQISVKVGTTLPAIAPVNYTYNEKIWTIESSIPSATSLTFTPSAAIETATSDCIGLYTTEFTNTVATKSGSSYTATFSSFGHFVTGTKSTYTQVIKNELKNLYLTSSNESLRISGLVSGDDIMVHNLNGSIAHHEMSNGNDMNIRINNGIYVVKITNTQDCISKKIIVK